MPRFLHIVLVVMATARWASAFSSATWKAASRSRPTHPFRSRTYCSSINNTPSPKTQDDPTSLRQNLLHDSLQKIHLDPALIEQANLKNMEDPTTGYDTAFGRPAIRAYRSFIHSTNIPDNMPQSKLTAQADQCARQIEFLRRRHLAHETEWVRHTDTEEKMNESKASRFPLIMILDNVRSAFNVGSLFRTADACGVQEVITVSKQHVDASSSSKLVLT